MVLEGLEKRVNSRGMKSLPYFLGIPFSGSRIVAVDLAGLDGKHRWKVLPKKAAVINLYPQEAMVTVHCQRTIKGKIA